MHSYQRYSMVPDGCMTQLFFSQIPSAQLPQLVNLEAKVGSFLEKDST
jgi:hypothetical protein